MNGQLVWFVAMLLYVYDAASLRDRDAVLRYSIGGVTATLMEPTFNIGRRRIFIPNPFRPDHSDLLLTARTTAKLSAVERYFIDRGASMYLMHQAVAVGCLITLFLLTPILAMRMNLLHACLISVGTTYWLCGFHWITMWKNRRLLGIDAKAVQSDMLHVLLCPPNAVNCARRIGALRQPRYGVLSTLRAFSRYDAEKYEVQVMPV